MQRADILEEYRGRVRKLVSELGLADALVTVSARPLSPQEAIGQPQRHDFPILEGKERVVEATVLGARGQAFTDSPCEFDGRVRDALETHVSNNSARAIFLATTNALLAHMGYVHGTVHCRDNAPEECAAEMSRAARAIEARKVGLIGFNPAIAEALVREFGTSGVRITDLNPQSIGSDQFGVTIWDGRVRTADLIRSCDLILTTGTTLVNGAFDGIWQLVQLENKRLVLYGVTAAGFCRLMNFERWCFKAQNG